MSEKSTITVVNEKTRRSSHQPKTTTPTLRNKVKRNNSVDGLQGREVQRTNSLEKLAKRSAQQSNLKKPTVPDIPEVDQNEDDIIPGLEKTDNALRVSYTKNNRKVSSVSRSGSNRQSAGYANEGYDHSNGSSIQGSMASLP